MESVMNCQKCNSDRVCVLSAKCSDMCYVKTDKRALEGYAPSDMGIGGGDYINFCFCLYCGQIQGEWPKEFPTEIEEI